MIHDFTHSTQHDRLMVDRKKKKDQIDGTKAAISSSSYLSTAVCLTVRSVAGIQMRYASSG